MASCDSSCDPSCDSSYDSSYDSSCDSYCDSSCDSKFRFSNLVIFMLKPVPFETHFVQYCALYLVKRDGMEVLGASEK